MLNLSAKSGSKVEGRRLYSLGAWSRSRKVALPGVVTPGWRSRAGLWGIAAKGLLAPVMIALVSGLVSLDAFAHQANFTLRTGINWSQGEDVVFLDVTENQGFCYLASMAGKFRGGGEAVYVDFDGSDWVLGGKSRQEGVAASAHCVKWASGERLEVTPKVRWKQGDRTKSLIGERDGFCFLTRVTGEFQGAGEVVYVSQEDGYWTLGGRSQQQDVAADARCVIWPHRLGRFHLYEHIWAQGQRDQSLPENGPPLRADEGFCYLTRVGGHFEGGGEEVYVYRYENTWWLGGTSHQEGVQAGARCINFANDNQ